MNDDLSSAGDYKGPWWEYHWAAIFWGTILSVVLFIGFSASALAQQTWNFTSGAMTVTSGSGPTGPITGTVTLAAALPANGATLVTPTSFAFASPLGFLTSTFLATQSNPQTQNGTASASFSFVTTNGQITAWTVVINTTWGSAGGDEQEYLTLSSSSGNDYQAQVNLVAACNNSAATCYSVGSTSAAGTWVDPPTASCPVTPAPTPPAPSGLQSMECGASNALITPVNTVMQYVSPNANGSPRECQKPGNTPKTWFIKTTTNGGTSFSYAMTLGQLALGN